MTSEANTVLSGSSPTKTIGNTVAMMARFTVAFLAGRRDFLRPGHNVMTETKVSPTCTQVR
jgi:hypothetical protein